MEEQDDTTTTVIQQPFNHQDFGKLLFGCEHYRRRCKLRAPFCNQIFSCRHCHNASMSAMSNPKDRHELVRNDVSHVICAVCNTEQQITKKQFRCHDCGICRVGGRENFFHCKKCVYRCPVCSKSVLNMSRTWERLEEEIQATAMPEEYHYKVPILCNDCNSTSEAFFHIFGHKCSHCESYNTRVIGDTDR
ncbi:unnamed protein product [Camellia sinensis]